MNGGRNLETVDLYRINPWPVSIGRSVTYEKLFNFRLAELNTNCRIVR